MYIRSLELKLLHVEEFLTYGTYCPIIAIGPALSKVLLGIVQMITAVTVSIFAALSALITSKTELLEYCWVHVKHGCGNIIAGIFEAIPFAGGYSIYYREQHHRTYFSIMNYPFAEAKALKKVEKNKSDNVIQLEKALEDFSPVLLQMYNNNKNKSPPISIKTVVDVCTWIYDDIDEEGFQKIKNICSLLISLGWSAADSLCILSTKFSSMSWKLSYKILNLLLDLGVTPSSDRSVNSIPLINVLRSYLPWELMLPLVTRLAEVSNINRAEDGKIDTPLSIAIASDHIPPEGLVALMELGAYPNCGHFSPLLYAKTLTTLRAISQKYLTMKIAVCEAFDKSATVEQIRFIIPHLLSWGYTKSAEKLLKEKDVLPPGMTLDHWKKNVFPLPREVVADIARAHWHKQG